MNQGPDHSQINEKELQDEKRVLEKLLKKDIQKLKRKETKLLELLEACANWDKVRHEGELIKFYFTLIKKGEQTLAVHDWLSDQPYELAFDPKKTPQDEMVARFKRARKLQRGTIPLTQQLELTRELIHQAEEKFNALLSLKTLEELVSFKAAYPFKAPSPKLKGPDQAVKPIYREFHSASGMQIWVGKSAKANEVLTFHLANGRDWWFHASGYAGSHVIIPLEQKKEPDEETVKDAMLLALYFSKARDKGEGEVCYTQKKYVARLRKGKTGQVQIAKHRSAWLRFDPARYKALTER